MPKITYLREFEGCCWARLEMDFATADGPIHVFTEKEVRALKDAERKAVWNEINSAINRFDDD